DMKMDNMYSYFIKSYKNTVLDLIKYIKDHRNKIALFEFLSSSQMTIMQILMIIFLTYRVYNNIISIVDYAALLNSIFSLMFQLNNLFNIIPQFYQNSLYAQNLINITQINPTIENEKGIIIHEKSQISIVFNNV